MVFINIHASRRDTSRKCSHGDRQYGTAESPDTLQGPLGKLILRKAVGIPAAKRLVGQKISSRGLVGMYI
jgi:hypothetical protein